MTKQLSSRFLVVLFTVCVIAAAPPSRAADGQVLITHAKALAGNVTPGDTSGYPVSLSRAGSYILGSDLLPGPNLDGIVAVTSDISIDLNGFRLSGGPAGGSNNARFGIFGRGDRLTVKNGTIGAFEGSAIHAPNRLYLIVENMRLINSDHGIYNLGGSNTRIQNSTIGTSLRNGIVCGRFCHVEGSVVTSNGARGIQIGSGTILGNTIAANSGPGIYVSDPGIGGSSSRVGFGNNTMFDNNAGMQEIGGTGYWDPLHPNFCLAGC